MKAPYSYCVERDDEKKKKKKKKRRRRRRRGLQEMKIRYETDGSSTAVRRTNEKNDKED